MVTGLALASRAPASAGPVVLVVMDGIGLGPCDDGDAVFQARTPTLDGLQERAAFRTLRAHGRAVGLPSDRDMGNSEVGHNALGAGRVIKQGASLVQEAVRDGSIFESDAWRAMVVRCTEGDGTLHLLGLLSDGNVHSHEEHLYALVRQADRAGIAEVRVHPLFDGRDVQDRSAHVYVERLHDVLAPIDAKPGRRYRIASGGGRMVTTMDRYGADWRIVERGWRAHVLGEARAFASALEAIQVYRSETPSLSDQVLPPFVVVDADGPVGPMRDGDACVLFNFRGDRAIEVSQAFDAGAEFSAFDRGPRPRVLYAGMTLYDGDQGVPRMYLVPPPRIERTVSERLAASSVAQYAVSETQKYGHVTYFWNGNRTGKFDEALETYVEVPSPEPPFDEHPEMSAPAVAGAIVEAIESGAHRFLRANFANGDMVGHTGRLEPTIRAVECVDEALGRILQAVAAVGGTLVVTADHGNADDMFVRDTEGVPRRDEQGVVIPRTSHTLNPVGLWVWSAGAEQVPLREDLPDASLANMAATLLELLGFVPPPEYEPSLIQG